MTVNWRMQDGDKVRAENGLHWAQYDFSGHRIATGEGCSCAPTADELAAWDAEAPVAVDAVVATASAPRPSRFARQSSRPQRGSKTWMDQQIRTPGGLSRLMDAEDSIF